MKYLLILSFIIFLDNCGGSKKNHNFDITVIDGYLAESNISIYDGNNKKLDNTKVTNNRGSFSYKDVKNDLIYIKSISGIDTMSDEVFNSVLYGVAKKASKSIISPLGSIVWAYNKSDKSIDYKTRAKKIQDNLNLKQNILKFDPISNISKEESSKIIQFNITLEAISRLINISLGGNFEYIFYASSYEELEKHKNINFLYSNSFINTLSSKLYNKYDYLNMAIVDLKLKYLQKSIAYIVDELAYFEANNKKLLKLNYKASFIITNPIIKEASLLSNLIIRNTEYASEYFNDINFKIHSLDIYKIIKGLKMIGGFRGILYRINDIKRETKSIKPSFFAESFLNKELLLKSSLAYDKLEKSISSGSPSQDSLKDDLIKNTIFLNMENQDIFDVSMIDKIQNQISLSFQFVNIDKDAINPNAELLVRKTELEANKKSFKTYISKLKESIQKSEDSAISISKIDTSIINKYNKENLIFSKSSIYKKNELQDTNIKKQKIAFRLVLLSSTQKKDIIKTSLNLDLMKAKEELLQKEINAIKISKEISNYKTKLAVIDDTSIQIKDKMKKDLIKYESLQKVSKNKILTLINKKTSQEKKINSFDKIFKNKTTVSDTLLEEHIEKQKKEEKQQNITVKLREAKNIYDSRLKDIENEKKQKNKEYEDNLNILSISLSKNKQIDQALVNKLKHQLSAIKLLENKQENIKISKKDLADSINFKVNGLKSCFDRDENDLFSISPDQDNSFIKIEIVNSPSNTIFSEKSLKKKKSDGINPFYIPLGEYKVNITVSNTDTDMTASKQVHFKIKTNCSDNTSLAFKAPLKIPNIPTLKAPELNTSKDIPNPNTGKNPPKINDNKPPKDN
jgi:hypothetical protein